MFAQRYCLSTAPGLLPFQHSCHTDGETEARSSKASSAGGRTHGQQSQAWQSQPSILSPCCLAGYGLCHTSRKMSPPPKGAKRPPLGSLQGVSHAGRAEGCERWELGTFQEKLGCNHSSHFLAGSNPSFPCQEQLLCTC